MPSLTHIDRSRSRAFNPPRPNEGDISHSSSRHGRLRPIKVRSSSQSLRSCPQTHSQSFSPEMGVGGVGDLGQWRIFLKNTTKTTTKKITTPRRYTTTFILVIA